MASLVCILTHHTFEMRRFLMFITLTREIMQQKKFTRAFKYLSKNDVAIAGGKGASLGEMTQAGFPVPEGFVVLASAFDYFLKETALFSAIDSALHKVNYKDMNSVEQASEAIQEMILSREIPAQIAAEVLQNFKKLNATFVAVRSSATAEDSASAAWAGQLNTYLNTIDKTLLENVKKCWASLFTPRAIFYRFEKNLHDHHISVAIVVQKMIASEIAGVAFSVHPVTCDTNQMIIESGYGLGEALVSGQITPDNYVVEKDKLKITDKTIASQQKMLVRAVGGGDSWQEVAEAKQALQKLSDKQILLLAKLLLKIEQHYGFPVDVEWAFADGKLYILQSRPITTLINTPNIQLLNIFMMGINGC